MNLDDKKPSDETFPESVKICETKVMETYDSTAIFKYCVSLQGIQMKNTTSPRHQMDNLKDLHEIDFVCDFRFFQSLVRL